MALKLDSVGPVIATRLLSLVRDKKTTQEITVRLGQPKHMPDTSDYYCPYQILGIGSEKIKYAAGIDAFQAIQLAMGRIGADLWALNQECSGQLRWEGDEHGDVGFPTPAGT
jgi:hypothetical protein